ncbi:MAG TPA: hypothetical protein VFW12_10175 [Candidatus Limnocylindria bacterium]|nr:hypothetical protein [Candidatus Limnocylindria bacterium]
MELAALASFALLVVAWVALPLRRPADIVGTIEPAEEQRAA